MIQGSGPAWREPGLTCPNVSPIGCSREGLRTADPNHPGIRRGAPRAVVRGAAVRTTGRRSSEPSGVFHYYLGAKYFNEIGPFDLYSCALAADSEHAVWDATTLVRDLHSYTLVPAWTLSCPRAPFTAERWHAFTHDVALLTDTDTAAAFAGAVTDKGYNASPFFSSVFGRIAAAVPIGEQPHAPAAVQSRHPLEWPCRIGLVWYSYRRHDARVS